MSGIYNCTSIRKQKCEKKERVKQKTIVLPKQAEIASKHSSEGTKIEEENAKITDLSMVCKGKESVVAGSSTV